MESLGPQSPSRVDGDQQRRDADAPPVFQNLPSDGGPMFQDLPSPARADGRESSGTFPDLPESSIGDARVEACRTNPPRTKVTRPLSFAQHAAIRMLVAGFGSVAVARELGVEYHTIGRWKRDPRFAAELERLRGLVTERAVVIAAGGSPRTAPPRGLPPAATTKPSSATPRRAVSDDADEDREGEAMIEHILRMWRA